MPFSVVKHLVAASARKKCNEKTFLAFFRTSRRKKLVRSSGDGQTYYSFADGMTASAQLYVFYFDRARSFNQWQRALYPNFIIKLNDPCSFNFFPSVERYEKAYKRIHQAEAVNRLIFLKWVSWAIILMRTWKSNSSYIKFLRFLKVL